MSAATLYSLPGPIRNALVSRWFPGLLVTTVLGPFYWLSAVTRVGGGDWGQFQTFGYMGGIAHPPGYPLIIGSINLATRVIRVDEPAHLANLVNATFATAAGVALFYAGWLLTHSRLAAALATLVFATGYSIWAQATQAGHISVQMLLVFLLVLALVAYDKRPTPTRLAAVAFAVGLSLTNHGLSVFMLPATALLVVIRRFPGISRPRTLLMAGAAGLVGMTPWLYVLRGLLVPVPANRPETIQRLSIGDLWHLIVGKPIVVVNESGVTSLSVEDRGTALLAEWPSFAHDVLREFGWFWIALSLVGWLAVARARPRPAGWIAWTGLSTLWFALATPPLLDSDRYFSVVYALLAVCLAAGMGAARQGVARLAGRLPTRQARYLAPAIGLVFLLATGVRVHQQLTGPARINVVRLRENAAEQAEIGLRIVTTMEPGGVYFTNWTSSWYPRYARHVLGFDRDLRIETVDFWTMGIDRADEVLASGRRLYLQRLTPEYEQAFKLVKRAGVYYEVLPKS
ncbi:MAG: DUF2723 domain-containing protein [Chloroflexi bacterium]|nr:DUF2723 domain-containing protein [Chloroflexota bacterium]